MAKTWDVMSKDERNASGLSKKEYNAKHGFGKQGELAARSEAASRAEAHSSQSPATSTTPAAQANNQPAVTAQKAAPQTLSREDQRKANEQSRYDADQARQKEAEAYRQSRIDLQNASKHSAHQVVDVSGNFQNHSNGNIQKMIESGQKFTHTEARRALGDQGVRDDNLYKGAGGKESWDDMMENGFQSQYDQSEYITQDQAKANRDQQSADRTAFYEGEGNDKYGQYDWFQKDQARHNQGSTPKQAQNTDARTEASSRAAAYKPPTKVVQDKPKPENSGKTNQYGDPEGTMYAGGSATFNESTGQRESYTGADGTVTNGGNNSPSPRYKSWDDLQRESDMKSELMKQVDQAGGRYNFLQQQSGASEEDYWNNTNQYKFDKDAWADKTYGGQFS